MSKKGENIYKRKDGRWEARYKKGVGENGRIIYGYCYGKTYREAKEKLGQRKSVAQLNGKPGKKSFADYCGEWLFVNQNRVKETTLSSYKTIVENHILPFFGGYFPHALSTELVTVFTNSLISKNLSARTIKSILVVFKSVLKYVSRFEQLQPPEVFMPKQPQSDIRILTGDEQKRLVSYLLCNMDDCKFGVLFALLTGLRIGEVCALRIKDVSLTEKTVRVRETMQRIKNLDGGDSKTKIVLTTPKSATSARIVPLTNTAFELCRGRINSASENAFLLTNSESKFIEPRVLQYSIKKFCGACKIKDVHFHTLRHTFATRCVEAGFEIKSLSEVLGHASPKITLDIYVHSSLEFKRQNMSKLEAMGF